MTRFFLHVHDGVQATDKEGVELPSLEAAVAEATVGLRQIVAQQVTDGRILTHSHVRITDENGSKLGAVTFVDAIKVTVGPNDQSFGNL